MSFIDEMYAKYTSPANPDVARVEEKIVDFILNHAKEGIEYSMESSIYHRITSLYSSFYGTDKIDYWFEKPESNPKKYVPNKIDVMKEDEDFFESYRSCVYDINNTISLIPFILEAGLDIENENIIADKLNCERVRNLASNQIKQLGLKEVEIRFYPVTVTIGIHNVLGIKTGEKSCKRYKLSYGIHW